jgi:tripartite-type tricarboxylate transporter receptor subunit TctC
MNRRFRMSRLAAAALPLASLLLAATAPAQAQSYPSRPIRLVVPYAPGGATDIIGRAAAAELSKTLGQPVTVENKPGAGGNLGADFVAKSPADGYTLLVSPSSLHGITPFLYNKLPYDPNKDLARSSCWVPLPMSWWSILASRPTT